MAILQDHLLVPSRTICSACSRLSMCVSGSTVNVVLKRRQCCRHRIVLRQPLVPFSSHHFFRDSSERRILPRRHLRGDQEVYVLRRPPKDGGIVAKRKIVRNHPTSSSSSDGSVFSSSAMLAGIHSRSQNTRVFFQD